MGETVFGTDGGNQIKVAWSQSYDTATRKTTVTVTGLYFRRDQQYAKTHYFDGTVTLRDANGAGAAVTAAALVYAPANNQVRSPNTTWKEAEQYGNGYSLGSVAVSHDAAGDAAVEIAISLFEFYTTSAGNFLAAQTKTEALENHPAGLVRVDTGDAWVMATPYVDTGSAWVQAVPHVDSGTDWDICG